jgi:4-hydroxybenzoate polyprenyltransferase
MLFAIGIVVILTLNLLLILVDPGVLTLLFGDHWRHFTDIPTLILRACYISPFICLSKISGV